MFNGKTNFEGKVLLTTKTATAKGKSITVSYQYLPALPALPLFSCIFHTISTLLALIFLAPVITFYPMIYIAQC